MLQMNIIRKSWDEWRKYIAETIDAHFEIVSTYFQLFFCAIPNCRATVMFAF